MAKFARENKLRERRVEKQARKDARRFAAANPEPDGEGDAPAQQDDPAAQPEPATAPLES